MKGIYLILLAISICANVHSQSVVIDKVNQDGSRVVITDVQYFRNGVTDPNPLGFNIICLADSALHNCSYALNVYISSLTSYTIPKNGLILLKNVYDDVIELQQDKESYETRDALGNWIPFTNLKNYVAEGTYPISFSDLGSLSFGVKKIRIETQLENLDVNYSEKKTKEIAHYISQSINAIFTALKVKKDIRDGF